MSDTIKSLIPNNPFYKPSNEQCDAIKSVIPPDATLQTLSKVQFADSGENFESVCCPFCHADLMDWWGGAMDAAYSEERGFMQLSVTMPCCGKESSLNNLEYSWPQGFYSAKITLGLDNSAITGEHHILESLKNVTGTSWRMIIAHY